MGHFVLQTIHVDGAGATSHVPCSVYMAKHGKCGHSILINPGCRLDISIPMKMDASLGKSTILPGHPPRDKAHLHGLRLATLHVYHLHGVGLAQAKLSEIWVFCSIYTCYHINIQSHHHTLIFNTSIYNVILCDCRCEICVRWYRYDIYIYIYVYIYIVVYYFYTCHTMTLHDITWDDIT